MTVWVSMKPVSVQAASASDVSRSSPRTASRNRATHRRLPPVWAGRRWSPPFVGRVPHEVEEARRAVPFDMAHTMLRHQTEAKRGKVWRLPLDVQEVQEVKEWYIVASHGPISLDWRTTREYH